MGFPNVTESNLARKRLHKVGDELVGDLAFDAEPIIENFNRFSESVANLLGQSIEISCRHEDDIAADRSGEVGWSTQRDKLSLMQNAHPIASTGFVHQVCRDHDRRALAAKCGEVVPEISPRTRVEARAGLIQEKEPGLGQQCLAQLDASLQTARERHHEIVCPILESHDSQGPGDAAFELGTADAVQVTVMSEVLRDPEAGVERRRLEHDAEHSPHVGGRPGDVRTEDAYVAGCWWKQSCHDAEERRLAATVRAEEAEDLPRSHVEADPAQCLARSVAVFQVACLER